MKTILLVLAVIGLSGCATYSASSYDSYGTPYVTTAPSVYFYGSSGDSYRHREAPIFYAPAFNQPFFGGFPRLAPRPQIRAPRPDHHLRQRGRDNRPERAERGPRRDAQGGGERRDWRGAERPDRPGRQDGERRQR